MGHSTSSGRVTNETIRQNVTPRTAQNINTAEDTIRDLFRRSDSDEIGTVEFEERMVDWLDALEPGTQFTFGRSQTPVEKTSDGAFKYTDRYGEGRMNSKRMGEWIGNNVGHDLNYHTWEDVGVRLKRR